MNIPALTLRSGDVLPAVGLGLWKIDTERVASIVYEAVRAGYRHFDCASDYGNERETGAGLRRAIDDGLCRRQDLWITSKLWNTYHRREHVEPALRRSLSDLGLEYLDAYLIHFPIALRYVPFEERYPPGWFFDPDAESPKMEFDPVSVAETWQGIEDLKEAGLVRNIGVCNFGTALLRDLLSYADDPPAMLQVESHPYLVQDKLLRFCQENSIVYTAFSPLGALSYFSLGMADKDESLLEVPVIKQIAAAHEKTPAQVLLRWGVQRGTAVIPKTSNPERLRENLDLFDFELTDDQMQQIGSLDRGRRFNDPGDFCQTAFNTFCPIYE